MNHITHLAKLRSAALARVESLSGPISSTDAEEVREILLAQKEAEAEYRKISDEFNRATATFTAQELIELGVAA